MLKISEQPCDFIIEETPSLKFFIIFIVFSLRPLRLCGGLNCYKLPKLSQRNTSFFGMVYINKLLVLNYAITKKDTGLN